MTDEEESAREDWRLAETLPAQEDSEGASPQTRRGQRRHASGRHPSSGSKPRRKVSVVGVIGELLVTAGVLVLLFLGWQTWWQSAVLNAQQNSAAAEQSKKFLEHAKDAPKPTPTPVATPDGTKTVDYGPPPVMKAPGPAQPFAVIYVPRFGADWKRTIRETVDVESVLNSYNAGVGHYPNTAMPGDVGNFAIAAHDTGYGNTFLDVSKLQVGDAIYIQTKDGYYTYRFRNMEYVTPSAVQVLYSVPQVKDAQPGDRYITMTTCNPPYHAQERIAAFGVLESWQPLSAGPPKEIAAEVGGS
ncbi:class E sortase [Humibacter sp.]|uniref:class E sortase n=1 Tax=Humibacter sp. TaxID=1940291 RepID=UPI002CF29653|nr:class E sortase [Humibacter sp.]HVX06774.1 class E sortase [Humibacter sp.]